MSYVNEYTCDGCGAKADGDLTPPGWSFDGKDLCPDCNPNSRRNQARRSSQHKGSSE